MRTVGDRLSLVAVRSSLLAAGILALTAAFLAEHRAELASLPAAAHAFIAALGRHGILNLPRAGESAAGGFLAMLLVLSWYGIGDIVVSLLRLASGVPPHPGRSSTSAPDPAWACALGAGVWSLVWFAFGLAGLYRSVTAVAALACGLALAALTLVRSWMARGAPRPADAVEAQPSALTRVAALLVGVPVAAAFLAALAPPTAKDALQYHVALPKAFLAAGGLIETPGNIANYFPLGAEMHGIWAMLLGRIVSIRAGEAAFGAAMFTFFPLLLGALLGWARERGLTRDWAWLAAALVAGVPTSYEVAGSGYVDLALALYVTLAIRAACRWWNTQDRANLAASALALGFALTVKLTALFMLLLLVVIVLIRGRKAQPEHTAGLSCLGGGLALVTVAVAVGCPWYLRTWVRTGSPVFPFFANIWPGQAPGWDLQRSSMLHGFNALYGGASKGPLDYLLKPLSLSLMGQREVAASYEGVLGVSLLVGAMLLVWALARGGLDTELKIAAAAGASFFVWWLVSAQVLRYLLPALPLLAVAAVAAAAALTARGAVGRPLRWLLLASVMAGELVTITWFAADNPVLAATGAEPRAAYLERRLDYYPYYRFINGSLPADVKIWLVDMRRDTYHLERPYVGDYLFEDYTLRAWVEAAVAGRDVQRRALAAGITHVLIRHDILFDYAGSPLVDDRRPRVDNLARLERLRSFLADGTRLLRADRRFALIELAR